MKGSKTRGRGESGQRRRRGRRGSKGGISREALDSLYKAVATRVYSELGLDYVGLGEGEFKDVLEPIVHDIASNLSRPTEESISKKILAQRNLFLKALATRLLEQPERLDSVRLEFIIHHAPDAAGKAAQALYEAAKRLGREDLAEALRALWEQYGKPTAARCPRCGFKSITPDLSCTICGATINEEEFKRSVDLDRMLDEWASSAPPELVREAATASIVYYDDGFIKAPSEPRRPEAIQLTLGRGEKAILEKTLGLRGWRKGESHRSTFP